MLTLLCLSTCFFIGTARGWRVCFWNLSDLIIDYCGLRLLFSCYSSLIAAASRLEDVALAAQFSSPFTATGSAQAAQQALVAHLPSSSGPADVPDSAVASDASPDGTSAANSPEYAAVKAYREQILEQAMTEYEAKSKEIGPIVEQHVRLIPAYWSINADPRN